MPNCFQVGSKLLGSRDKFFNRLCWCLLEAVQLLSEQKASSVVLCSEGCWLGFMQKEGIDYNEVFAPVSKHITLRTLLALAAAEDMELHQLDIKTAFLNGDLEETIYIKQPEGYAEGGPSMVCRLRKSLYGLKQASRAGNTRLKQELESMGFTASGADAGLFTAQYKGSNIYILVYVDDILVAAKNLADINYVKARLRAIFDVKDLGEAKYFEVLLRHEFG